MKKSERKKTRNTAAGTGKTSRIAEKLRLAKKELETETCLEKVRVKALRMKRPDDMLDICRTISQQLERLGIKEIRNVQTAIFYPDRNTYMNYEFYAKHNKTLITETTYTNNRIHHAFAKKMLKGKGEFFVSHIRGEKKVKDWIRYQKTTNVFIDKYLNTASSLNYYWHSLGPVALGISTYIPLIKDELALFHRFLKVFELAYRRYLDIEKAEAQAREAEIELALERVRAKAMTMQRSGELADLVAVVFRELTRIGFPLTSSIIWIHDHAKATNTLWIASAEMNKPPRPYNITPFHNSFFKSVTQAWKARDAKWTYALKGKPKKEFEKAFLKELPNLPAAFKKALVKPEQVVFSASFNNFGALEIVSTEPLSDKKLEILHRFGKVFDLSYTRFNDLLKAEAQAREAQIEAALERVRARTMAMYKSDELTQTAELLFEQLKQLGAESQGVAFAICDRESNMVEKWTSIGVFSVPYTFEPGEQRMYEAWKNQASIYEEVYEGERLKRYYELFMEIPAFKEGVQKFIDSGHPIPTWQKNHAVTFKYGYLLIITTQPFNETQIFNRFAKVFEQTYTRFLDLQKAEAQARESQIQLALERVRARTMAMHQSDEITEVVKLLYQEFDNLKLSNESTDIEIGLIDEETGIAKVWAHLYLSDGSVSTFSFPFAHFDEINHEFERWRSIPREKRNELFITTEFSGKEWNKFKKLAKGVPELAEMFDSLIKAKIKKWVTHNAYFSHGLLTLQGTEHYSQETQEIQKRFAKVFEQTYIRFLDLKKAEAQARESQIQLALERVRARTMAMYHSDELLDIIVVIANQIQQLNIKFSNISFGVNNKEYDLQLWMAVKGYPKAYHIQWTFVDNPGVTKLKEAQKTPEKVYSDVLTRAENNEWLQHIFNCNPPLDIFSEKSKKQLLNTPGYARSIVIMKDIFLVMGNYAAIPYTEHENEILKRFARVFEQTYTRFLDLQKAEAQAREAQIEASLERVRARTMAMHNSTELLQVINVVSEQLQGLGFPADSVSFITDNNEKGYNIWLSRPGDNFLSKFYIPRIPDRTTKMYNDAIKNGSDFYTYVLTKDEKDIYFDNFFEKTVLKDYPDDFKQPVYDAPGMSAAIALMDTITLTVSNFRAIPYKEADINIIKRFAFVFQQTYTRFLDLQKAEAQAREAQIEAGLERVRSRSMAMHQTSELQEVIHAVHKELLNLNISVFGGSFVVINNDVGPELRCWGSGGTANTSEEVLVPHFNMPFCTNLIKSINSGPGFFTEEFSQKDKKRFFTKLFTQKPWSDLSDEQKKETLSSLGGYTRSVAVSKHTSIFIINQNGKKFTETENDILKRFAKVFEQTYTRFLDLQRAEAQAREAKIEAALEKVRSRSLAMHKADELGEVAAVVFEKLRELDMPVNDGVAIVTHIEGSKDQVEWMENPGFPSAIKVYQPYYEHPILADYWKAKNEGLDFIARKYTAEQSRSFFNHIFEHTDYKYTPQEIKDYCLAAESYSYFAAFQKNSSIFINDYSGRSLTEPEIDIVKRFSKVFEQSYVRFLDLQKAEVQAREAQIEAALERVRARAMAMHNSEELKDVAMELRQQMGQLGQKDLEVCAIHLYEEDPDFFESWGAMRPPGNESKIYQGTAKFPKSGARIVDEMMELYTAGQKDYVIVNEKDKAVEWFEVMKKYAPQVHAAIFPAIKNIPVEDLKAFWSLSDFSGGSLLIVTYSYPDETSRNLLRRSSNVFDLAYRRFKDLKKSEEQTREANIELGLERVRARAMAMQSSGELSDLVNTVFKELTRLDFALNWCIINIIDAPSLTNTVWAANPDINKTPESYLMKFEDYPFHHAMMKGYQERKTKYVYTLEGEEKKIYDEYLFKDTEFRRVPAEAQAASRAMKRYVVTFTFSNFGGLQTVSETPLSESSIDILSRFGKVFDLTYTRFNDLQKAEAQAREAQIETALEKVRSHSMGMQKSEELKEVIRVVFDQFVHLNINIDHAGFVVDYKPKGDWHFWIADKQEIPSKITHPYFDSVWAKQFDEAKEKGINFFATHLSFEEKNKFYQDLFNYIPGLSEQSKEFYFNCPGLAASNVLMDNVALYIENFSATPYTEEENKILMRFGKVFQQTYTRFLDLQKAEALAREAQIELGLERVRVRAMAMQKSTELKQLIATVSTELSKLDFILDRCFINVIDPQSLGMTWWMANPETSADPMGLYIKYHEHIPYVAHLEAWKERKEKWEYVLEGDIKKSWDKFLFVETDLSTLPPFVIEAMRSNEKVYLSSSFNNFGYLSLATLEPLTDEQFDIMLRFAKVFDLTYTRFNDLQKAEAQTREAQVEAALERVRSRSMGMQHSDELAEVATMLFQQVKALGVPQWTCGFSIFEIDDKEFTWYPGGPDGEILPPSRIPLLEHPIFMQFNESRKRGDELYIYEKTGEVQADHYRYMLTLPVVGEYLQSRLDAGEVFPGFQIDHLANFSHGNLIFITYEHFPEMHDIFKRFAKVFDQTYTRFLDLQRAEAQAREAQIEASLERIRSRTMGMQKTDELKEIVALLYEESNKFGFESVLMILNTRREEDDGFNWWFSANEQTVLPQSYFIPDLDEPVLRDIKSIWESGKPDGYIQMGGSLKKEHDRRLFTETGLRDLPDHLKEMMRSYESVFLSIANMKNGFIEVAANEFISGDRANILQRYAKVFEQTYTRFLDLQKAEAQAKEAQIEAALERVRSRSIAMRKSGEIAEIAAKIFGELRQLDLALNRVLIWTFNDDEKYSTWWSANPEVESTAESYRINYNDNPVFMNYLQAWQKREPVHLYFLAGETKDNWSDFLFEHTELSRLPEAVRKSMRDEGDLFTISVISDYGLMMTGSLEPLQEASIDIIQRFGRVFQQSYTRYLDVQKAEVQAREAEIELGLERVRARTMSMQKSDELKEVVQTLSTEIGKLDVIFTRTSIVIYEPDSLASTWWMSNPETNESFGLFVKYHELRPYLAHLDAWRERKKSWQYILEGEDKKQWDHFIFNETDLSHLPEYVKGDMQGKEMVCLSCSFSNFGYLVLESPDPISSDQFDILYRFAKVFDLTYTRFMDIQKAEAQAREAEIQLALERIRARTMAMQRSDELLDVITIFSEQLANLKIHFDNVSFGVNIHEDDFKFWLSATGAPHPIMVHVPYIDNPAPNRVRKAQEDGLKFFADVLNKEENQHWVKHLIEHSEIKFYPDKVKEFLLNSPGYARSTFILNNINLYVGNYNAIPYSDEENKIFERFSRAFEQSYTRFRDLQKAEAQAREAHIEAGLERVRSASLSMETTDDLQKVVDIVFVELNKLEIGMDHTAFVTLIENSKDYYVWVGSADANFTTVSRIPYNNLTQVQRDYNEMIENRPSLLSKEYTGETKKEYSRYLFSQTGFKDNTPEKELRLMMDGDSLITSIVMLENTGIQIVSYRGHKFSASDENILNRFTNVFEQAYIRFMDIKKSEEQAALIKREKERLEKTLNDLQAAQKQLIQTEKMASLGELTAGIAHEIQNPLNFVNNFSDVSNELIEEMKTELASGNHQLATEIANDIKQNLEKILHHGKRADGIVKGMLQHSRTSTGQKEPTDINNLAAEYLNLAYHGMRARDKSFNAKFETGLDVSVGRIEVIPQDIGRVILNLINNAFYAVSERKKQNEEDYQPTVTVSTKNIGDKVEIRVKDNGNGIPDSIKEKIFQPFFTTKPTGQGTGLGLSLSYDIVKAHGGEILLETKEGEGSAFIITLPA